MRTRRLRTSVANLVICALCCCSACVAGTARADPVAPTPPPNEAPGVPNPGPEIIAGTPGSPDRLPLSWDWAPFSTADYIITGTTGGVGAYRKPPLWLKPGDVVEVEVSGVGLLRNFVVQEGASAM